MKSRHLVLILVVMACCVVGCAADRTPAPTPDGMQEVRDKNGNVIAYIKEGQRFKYHNVKRDTTTMTGHGGTYDTSTANVTGNVEPGGPGAFNLFAGTWEQRAAAFVFQAKAGSNWFSATILGFLGVVAGVALAIYKKDAKWVLLSVASLIYMGAAYAFQEHSLLVLIIGAVFFAATLVVVARKYGFISFDLGVTRAALGAVAAAIETDPVTSPKGSPLKQKIQAEVLDSDVSTDAIEDAIDEAKP